MRYIMRGAIRSVYFWIEKNSDSALSIFLSKKIGAHA